MEGINLMALLGLWATVALVLMSGGRVEAYQNYTVGDSLGWYDDFMKPTVDYAKWAAGKNFTLGDFLIFNTDTNHTVVQTFNETTYQNCDSEADDVYEWSTADPEADANPSTVAVPLTKEGVNYFFSGDYDGWQCAKGGQKMEINVTHGEGLPPSLSVPPAASSPPTDDGSDTPAMTNAPSVTGPVADTPPDTSTDTASPSDAAARIDGVFLALALMLMLPFCVIW